MQPLTEDQQARLDALLRELATLPVPELIAEAGRLRGKPPMSEQLVNRMRSAFSGALAAQKIVSYLQIMRMVNAQSANFAAHTRDRCIQAKLLRAQQSLD